MNIRNDSWIPSTTNMKVQDQDAIPHHIQGVHQLIHYGEQRWNKELITSSFSERDAEAIIRIPLSMRES